MICALFEFLVVYLFQINIFFIFMLSIFIWDKYDLQMNVHIKVGLIRIPMEENDFLSK
jgi:hypothetical protein